MIVDGDPTARQHSYSAQFFHQGGRHSARANLDRLLSHGTDSIRGAVCYFLPAGLSLLSQHSDALRLPDSFFVASVAFPTDLDALASLHDLCPHSIYIHLGAVTPCEPRIGRSLMHTKVFLTQQGDTSKLWVGSHNLTASAIEGGNFEAAFQYSSPSTEQVVADAASHLEACRQSAELFDRSRLDDYRGIQGGRGGEGVLAEILVINAELRVDPPSNPYTVQVRVPREGLDDDLQLDRRVHLYLYPPGILSSSKAPDRAQASLWKGQIAGVQKTESNANNPGVTAGLDQTVYDLDVTDPYPVLLQSGSTSVKFPSTQAVLRLDVQKQHDITVYSLSRDPLLSKPKLVPDERPTLTPVSPDMVAYFTKESIVGSCLAYRSAVGTSRRLMVTTYDNTDAVEARLRDTPICSKTRQLEVEVRAGKLTRGLQRFFFLSKRHLKRGDE